MIVHLTDTGWEVIYHRAHALLAAQLAGQWRRSNSPLRLYETIAAISHHDDLTKEWEDDALTEAGAPLDFTLVKSNSLEGYRQLIEESRYRGRWVAMLVSMHASYLNQGEWGKSPEWDSFLKEQLEFQQKCCQGLKINKKEAERAYQFMRWCDRLSLILAQKQIPEAGRALEITSGIDEQRYDIRTLDHDYLTVEPWPFESEQFTVNVEATRLSELKFTDHQALNQALQEAPIEILEWTFQKS